MIAPLAQWAHPALPFRFVLSLMVLTCFTYIAAPWYGQKIFAARNERTACDNVRMGHLTGLLAKIGPAVNAVPRDGDTPEQRVELVALENTRQQIQSILERSPILEHLFADGAIGFACGIYSVETGEVTFLERRFQASRA